MAWYNSSWLKRKAITNTGGASGAQTDYQMKYTVTYDSDMKSDFSDLRFTKADGTTLLDAWMESHTASTSAIVWVETDTPANTIEADIYMYYGNSGASSAWDGPGTFEFIDEFNRTDSSTVGNGWSETGSACITSNKLTASASGLSTVFRNFTYSGGSYATDVKIQAPALNKLGYLVIEDGSRSSYITMAQSSAQLDRIQSYLPTNTLLDPFSTNTDYILTNARVDTTHWDYMIDYGATGSTFTDQAPSTVSSNNKLTIYIGNVIQFKADWVKIRKYVQNPATFVFGSEEDKPSVSGGMWYYNLLRQRNS